MSLGAIRKTDTSNHDVSLLYVLFKDPDVEGLWISEQLDQILNSSSLFSLFQNGFNLVHVVCLNGFL